MRRLFGERGYKRREIENSSLDDKTWFYDGIDTSHHRCGNRRRFTGLAELEEDSNDSKGLVFVAATGQLGFMSIIQIIRTIKRILIGKTKKNRSKGILKTIKGVSAES